MDDLRLGLVACAASAVAAAAAVFNCLVEQSIDAKIEAPPRAAPDGEGGIAGLGNAVVCRRAVRTGLVLLYAWVNPLTMWLTFEPLSVMR